MDRVASTRSRPTLRGPQPSMTTERAPRLLRAIVIDDEAESRFQVQVALLASALISLVGEASNGMRGAELAEREQPDVIVLDLDMPVMDGYEALPLLRQVAPGATIVVRSNAAVEDAESRVLRLGARRFVRKFLGMDELRGIVEEAVPRPRSLCARPTSHRH